MNKCTDKQCLIDKGNLVGKIEMQNRDIIKLRKLLADQILLTHQLQTDMLNILGKMTVEQIEEYYKEDAGIEPN